MTNQTPIRVGILGASGYGGAELTRRLLHHPHAQITGLASRQYLGQHVDACWPQLTGRLEHLVFEDSDKVIDGCELVFCATPHGATAPLVKRALNAGKRVIDLSADFRLDPKVYEHWYQKHPYPELYERARYGLVELHREELVGTELVAVPGCNSSTAILALAPLAANNLLGPTAICNIITGVSGAGRSVSLGLHYAEVNENAKPYKVAGTHRHTAEIEATLGRLQNAGKALTTHAPYEPYPVSFNPHLAPMSRGILATCYTKPDTSMSLTHDDLFEHYRKFYGDDPLVSFSEALPQTKAVYGSDRTLVSARLDERTGQIISFAVTDNLGKGAAGQALQNFNVMNGFPETLGLITEGVWP